MVMTMDGPKKKQRHNYWDMTPEQQQKAYCSDCKRLRVTVSSPTVDGVKRQYRECPGCGSTSVITFDDAESKQSN